LQKFVTPFIIDTVIDTFCKRVAEGIEEEIRSKFHDNLNLRESDYATSKAIIPPPPPPYYSGDALISKLFRYVTGDVGADSLTTMLVLLPAVNDTIVQMDIDNLVKKASGILDSLDTIDSTWSLAEYQETLSEWLEARDPELNPYIPRIQPI
jgi:hypothetical protein